MSDLCMCGSADVRILSERDADGFGDFIWAECLGCGIKARSKFVSERRPQSNQECFDDFNEIIKPFEQQQQRIAELEQERDAIAAHVDRMRLIAKMWRDGSKSHLMAAGRMAEIVLDEYPNQRYPDKE